MLLSSSILKKKNQKTKPISILGIFLTNSKYIQNCCSKCNDFPTDHHENNIFIFSKISA